MEQIFQLHEAYRMISMYRNHQQIELKPSNHFFRHRLKVVEVHPSEEGEVVEHYHYSLVEVEEEEYHPLEVEEVVEEEYHPLGVGED